jgi:hypothetical protein
LPTGSLEFSYGSGLELERHLDRCVEVEPGAGGPGIGEPLASEPLSERLDGARARDARPRLGLLRRRPPRSAPYAYCQEFMGRYYVVVSPPAVSTSRYANVSVDNGDGTGRVTGTQRIGWRPTVAWSTTAGWEYRTSSWWFGHDGSALSAEGWGYWAAPPTAMQPFIGDSLYTGNYTSHTFVVPGRGLYWVGKTSTGRVSPGPRRPTSPTAASSNGTTRSAADPGVGAG